MKREGMRTVKRASSHFVHSSSNMSLSIQLLFYRTAILYSLVWIPLIYYIRIVIGLLKACIGKKIKIIF
jgi:hypothetical protein